MAFTNLAGLSSAIYALTVSGVKTKAQYRPTRLSAGEMPYSFARLPTRQRNISTLSYGQDLKQATIEWVFFVKPLNLSTQVAIDAQTVALIDAIGDVLETNAAALGMDAYEITTDEDTIDDGSVPVQVIIVSVEVSG